MVKDNVNFLHSTLADEMQQLVQQSECDTLILDNLDAMLGESFEMDYLRRNHFIQGLREIVDELKIRIILCAPVSEKAELRRGAMNPSLEDITWARPLTALADQVIALYRPAYYDAIEDDWGNSLVNRVDFHFLKDLQKPDNEKNLLILTQVV